MSTRQTKDRNSSLQEESEPQQQERSENGESSNSSANVVGVIRLVGSDTATTSSRRLQWDEKVVDNEHMGKKSSKSTNIDRIVRLVCCIYHKPKKFDEDSSDSSSDENVNAYERQPKRYFSVGHIILDSKHRHNNNCEHQH